MHPFVLSTFLLVLFLSSSCNTSDAFAPTTSLLRGSTAEHHQHREERLLSRSVVLNLFFGSIKPITVKSDASTEISDSQREQLKGQGFTKGLTEALVSTKEAFPNRIWIVDNSGSMSIDDGNRFIESSESKDIKLGTCTRWKEMQQTVDFHCNLAATIQAPTTFRLLNNPGRNAGPQQFSVADRGMSNIENDLAVAKKTMDKTSPGGVTPLIGHIKDVRKNIKQLEPTLRRDGTKVPVIIATDGLPSNDMGESTPEIQQKFADALKSLEGLPIWMVIRLCTDDDEVIDYYNDLDNDLELSLEVLDDFVSEAKEVWAKNKWLNYGLPLHRMREMGFHDRTFDLLDERRLTRDEIFDFCRFLFGEEVMCNIEDPQIDWKGFVSGIEFACKLEEESKPWNPMTKRVGPWINCKELAKIP